MTDILRIKRRALGGAAGAPASLAVGELAFNEVDGGLYIGRSNASVIQVNAAGGVQPGTPILIRRQDVSSAVATVDFTTGIDSTYDEYEICFWNVRIDTTGQNFFLRISQNAGSSWAAGAGNYTWVTNSTITTPANNPLGLTSDTKINLYSQNSFPATGNVANTQQGTVKCAQPSSTVARKHFMSDLSGLDNVGAAIRHTGSGSYIADANAINGVRFYPGTGNILSGTFNLYGIKK